jgi:hypothetical protein
MYPGARYLAAGAAVIVPLPPEPTDTQLIEWTTALLVSIFGAEVGAASPASASPGSPAQPASAE